MVLCTNALLRLEELQRADTRSLTAVHLLGCYARRAPVMLVTTATDLRVADRTALLGDPRADTVWRCLELATDARAPEPGWPTELDRRARDLAEAACLAVLPWAVNEAAAWLDVDRPTAAAAAARLEEVGLVRAVGSGKYGVASPRRRDSVQAGLAADRRRRLHARLAKTEAADPFAANFHVTLGGLDADGTQLLAAIEQAWIVSDLESALELAQRLSAADVANADVDLDLLLALLSYDAERPEDTDQYLLAALERGSSDSEERLNLTRLLGCNAIFGLGQHDRGLELFSRLVDQLEAAGKDEQVGYLRNSMAFALFRSGRIDEAVAMEKKALAPLREDAGGSDFLIGVVQLNLGRLYRQLGESEDALELFARVVDEEHSPYMLLIIYTTLAQMYGRRGEHDETLAVYRECFELCRDLDLENVSYPVVNALTRPVGKVLEGRLSRGDEMFFCLYLNLAMACRQAGSEDLADRYLDSLRRRWDFLGDTIWERAEQAVAGIGAGQARSGERSSDLTTAAVAAAERHGDLVEARRLDTELASTVARVLSEGRSVAWVRVRAAGQAELVDSVVLFDPRQGEQASRLNPEIGVAQGVFPASFGHDRPAVRPALVLSAAARYLDSPLLDVPLGPLGSLTS